MLSQQIKLFLAQNEHIIAFCIRKNRSNVNALSLMLCEMMFYTRMRRFCEYIAFILLFIIKSKRCSSLSVGQGQVQVRYWLDCFGKRNVFDLLFLFVNPLANCDAINSIISECPDDTQKIIAKYRGEARTYHMVVFDEIKRQLSNSGFLCAVV